MTWSDVFYVARRSIDAGISEQDVRSFLYKEQHSDATVHDVVKQMRVFSRVANPLPAIPALKGCDDYV
jgi:hypothetical protein